MSIVDAVVGIELAAVPDDLHGRVLERLFGLNARRRAGVDRRALSRGRQWLGVILLFAFIVIGVFVIADPEFLGGD